RIQEEPTRRVEQQETEMTPTVAPRAEMGRSIAAVGRERRGHLGHAQVVELRFDDHLARELHAGRTKIEDVEGAATKAADAAMQIVDVDAEEETSDARENRVADVPILPRHRARFDL